MNVADIEKLIPLLNANGVYFFKSGEIEIVFKQSQPSTITVATPDGKTVTATQQDQKPIETVKSSDAPIPTDSLDQEMPFDQVLNWSTGSDEFSVAGTNDGIMNDQPIDDPKINGVSPV